MAICFFSARSSAQSKLIFLKQYWLQVKITIYYCILYHFSPFNTPDIPALFVFLRHFLQMPLPRALLVQVQTL